MSMFESEALKSASRQAAQERQSFVDALSKLGAPSVTERAARLCEMSADQIRLMCGEVTAGEMRTVKAVLASRAAAIRALTDGTSAPISKGQAGPAAPPKGGE